MDVFKLNHEQFKEELYKRLDPNLVLEEAPHIYVLLTGAFNQGCYDSVLREWAFQWASKELDIEYKEIYERWLHG